MLKNKVLLVDDDEVSLLLYKNVLENHVQVTTASNAHQALDYLKSDSFAVVISDYIMPELNGVELFQIIRNKMPAAMRILITGYADLDVAVKAVNVGNVYKFLIKPCEHNEMVSAVMEAIKVRNKTSINSDRNFNLIEPLTDRETEVLTLLYRGLTNKEIALSLDVSLGTVKTHVNNILGKLAVNSRIKAVIKAKKIGLLSVI